MKVLLTGAGGFVGHHTLAHLLKTTNWSFVATDSFRHFGISARIRAVFDELPDEVHRVKVVSHDLTVPIDSITAQEFGNPDVIINMASESHVDRSIDQPRRFVENNVNLVLSLLEYARELSGLKSFIQVSTDEVYGPADSNLSFLEWSAHKPSNPYSASKSAQESIAIAYWRTYDIPIILTNTMNIIGERQDVEKFVPLIMRSLRKKIPVPIHAVKFNDNWVTGSRFYLHARNQADALRFLINHYSTRNLKYSNGLLMPERFNVCGEVEVHNDAMVRLVAKSMGIAKSVDSLINYVNVEGARPGHDLRYALDGARLKNLGWYAPVPFEKSLQRTVQWTLSNPEWLGRD